MRKNILSLLLIFISLAFPLGVYADEDWDICDHYWDDWEVVTSATPFKPGEKQRICQLCNVLQEAEIPKVKITTQDKKAISVVQTFFKGASRYNIKQMRRCFAKKPKGLYFEKNKYLRKYCKQYNKRYISYEIMGVHTNGNSGWVKVDYVRPEAGIHFFEYLEALEKYLYKHPRVSDNKLYRHAYKKLNKYTKKHPLKRDKNTEEGTITLKLKKTKKGWKIRKPSHTLIDIVNCGYQTAYDEWFDEL